MQYITRHSGIPEKTHLKIGTPAWFSMWMLWD